MPVCARCLNDHMELHRLKGKVCDMVDVMDFFTHREGERVAMLTEFEKKLCVLVREESYVGDKGTIIEESCSRSHVKPRSHSSPSRRLYKPGF